MRGVRALAVVLLASVAFSTEATPSPPLQPLVVGWEQFFDVTWSVADRRGRPIVWGRIYNKWNFAAANMRLLVDELDAGGQIVDQRVGWLGFTLTPGTTAPFEIPVAHGTPNHRVSVFAFDWVQTSGRHRF